jgi:hypothetical protein
VLLAQCIGSMILGSQIGLHLRDELLGSDHRGTNRCSHSRMPKPNRNEEANKEFIRPRAAFRTGYGLFSPRTPWAIPNPLY